MKRILGLLAVTLLLAPGSDICRGQTIPNGRYFGQTPPGFTPEIFAPGVISLASRFEYCLVYSPDLNECVFGLTNSSWGGFNLLYTRMGSDSTWIEPVPAPFQGDGDAVYPTFSTDGNLVCFASSRPHYPPMRIWSAQRDGAVWGEPLAVDPPVYSGYDEWGSSLTDDGTLYFCSDRPGGYGNGDIYRAVTAPDGVVTVENLGPIVNSPQLEGAPRIAPDGSYLIYESRRPGGYGSSDLYITFQQGGTWSTPRNLGEPINTSQIEDGPFVSPDGKYLFFNRRRSAYTTEQSEIWWVDARAALDPGQSGLNDPAPRIEGTPSLSLSPNPFSAATTLTYSVPASGFVSLKVFDVVGREVQCLVQAPRPAGTYSAKLEFPSGAGRRGVYFCRLQVEDRKPESVKGFLVR